jgi:hypothetical protein
MLARIVIAKEEITELDRANGTPLEVLHLDTVVKIYLYPVDDIFSDQLGNAARRGCARGVVIRAILPGLVTQNFVIKEMEKITRQSGLPSQIASLRWSACLVPRVAIQSAIAEPECTYTDV